MENMDQTLEAILGNPQVMQQIMSIANSLGNTQSTPADSPGSPQNAPTDSAGSPQSVPPALSTVSNLLAHSKVDSNQLALLHALKPFIPSVKLQKLEKAMQAAQMAQAAGTFLENGGLQALMGR